MKTLRILAFIMIASLSASAQCINISQYPFDVSPAAQYNDTVVHVPDMWAGEYSILEGLTAGESYSIISDSTADYFSIRDAFDSSILLTHGPNELTFSTTTRDKVAVHLNLLSPPCGSENIARSIRVICTTCTAAPPMIGANTTDPKATLDINGEIKIGDSGRPAQAGMIRWNDTANDFEGYNGSQWISLTKSNQPGQWGTQPTNMTNEDEMVIATDGDEFDYFGQSVAISGDYAIVGAYLDDVGSNSNQGSAYIFYRVGSTWTQQTKITANDGDASDNFGRAVAISGDYAIVGAYRDDVGSNSEQGSVYIFHRVGSTWTQQTKITANDGDAFDNFGSTVAISGDYVIVGAYRDDVGSNGEQGSAYIFYRVGSTWTQQTKITANDGGASDNFGQSVAISGDYAIVGAYRDDVGSNSDQGSAYIFYRVGSTWTQQTKITANDGDASDNFGRAVAISGDYAIVGAYRDDVGSNGNQGSAYIFERVGSTWTQQTKITANDGGASDLFSNSVAISGDYAIVGANGDDVGSNSEQGSAYIFYRVGSTWTQQTKITANDGGASDYFGASVAISGDYAIVGARGNDVGSNGDQGSVYIFSKK